MMLLVQVGKATWVDPATIEAIEWGGMYECPMIILSSGQHVHATHFKDLANAEANTNALLVLLRQAVRATSAGVKHVGTGANDNAAWV